MCVLNSQLIVCHAGSQAGRSTPSRVLKALAERPFCFARLTHHQQRACQLEYLSVEYHHVSTTVQNGTACVLSRGLVHQTKAFIRLMECLELDVVTCTATFS